MGTLKQGSSGVEVAQLQARLQALGFNPGELNGDFGAGTEAAVRAYQQSEGLLVDGAAGPRTKKALGLTVEETVESVIPQVTAELVSKLFPHTPKDHIRKHLPVVLDALAAQGLVDKPMVLMALATIRAETEGFEPISEGPSKYNTSSGGGAFDLYDHRKDLGNTGPPDGERYKGRGFVQLTGRANYGKYGAVIGLGDQLVTNPELANDPRVAAQLLASFLKSKELAIKEALLDHDLLAARKLVNGGRHGLDRFTDAYTRGVQAIA